MVKTVLILFTVAIILSLNCEEYNLSHKMCDNKMIPLIGPTEIIGTIQQKFIYYDTVIGTIDTLAISCDSLVYNKSKYSVSVYSDSLILENYNEKLVWFKQKEFIAFINHDDPEINSDIEHSTNNIKQILKNKDIKVYFMNSKSDNAYLLINGIEQREIESALTDVDLLQICSDFYKIEIK